MKYTHAVLQDPNFVRHAFRSLDFVEIAQFELKIDLEIYVLCNGHPSSLDKRQLEHLTTLVEKQVYCNSVERAYATFQ